MTLPLKPLRAIALLLALTAAAYGRPQYPPKKLVLGSGYASGNRIDLRPYLYYTDPAKPGFIPAEDIIGQLAVNRLHTFRLYATNSTADTLIKIMRFGSRYVTAHSISIVSASRKELLAAALPTNTVLVRFPPKEDLVIFFSVNELNRASPEKLSADLVSSEYAEEALYRLYATQSFFLGLFAFLFVFNMVIFYMTRWRVYFKYSLYIFCALAYFLYYFGLLQEIFPSLNNLSLNLVYTWYSFIFIAYFIFLNDFGNYREYVPRAHQLLNVGIVFKSIETVVNTLLHFAGFDFIYSALFINAIIGFEIILMGFILFYILKNKHIRGRFVIAASIMLIIGAIIEQAKIFPSMDNTFFAELGITAELLTFSVGLGYITKVHYDEKRDAELRYIKQLLDNQKLQKNITEQLEEKVKQRTTELKEEKQLVEKKNAENELLLAEIHHRVKNNLQVITSLLSLQEKSVKNANVKLAILEGKERIRSMELVHKMLYYSNSYGGIEMNAYVKDLCASLVESFGLNAGEVELHTHIKPITLSTDTAIPMGLILNELIINSLKHAKRNSGKLIMNIGMLEPEAGCLQLELKDNGCGKISDMETSGSFGFKIIRALVRQLGGLMEINEQEGLHYFITFKNYKRIA